LFLIIKRNLKMFFKDKALFFTALITPVILLVLYATFLSNVYRDSFVAALGEYAVSQDVIDGIVGGQLVSSLLSVSCITVAFCSNMLMVQDKVTGAYGDFCTTPVRRSSLAISYFIASAVSTLIVGLTAMALGMIYLAATSWYLSAIDAFAILLDVIIISLFGTALSSIVNCFLSSQGQISAVGSIVSSCYGFICGAYMPISAFSEGLAKVLCWLPGTYATSILRNHALRGAVDALPDTLPKDVVEALKESTDMSITVLGDEVSTARMYLILTVALAVSVGIYVLIHMLRSKKKHSAAR
jgi:multidrug/hemolysin transport system permease protein